MTLPESKGNSLKTVMLITREMQARCFADRDLDRIAGITDLQAAAVDEMDDSRQLDLVEGADIAVTGWGTCPITDEMLDRAPGLRLMCHSAGSVKHLVSETFAARGIRVSSARGALARGVAEFAFGMMLVSMKAVWQYHGATLTGQWKREDLVDWIREPHGATVGIVGASHTGREMIRLCSVLELGALLLHDPYVTEQEAKELGAEPVGLDELMQRSDVVSLHTPNTEETHHLIDARNLALMRDRAIFINTARGACVDEAALVAELEKGRILACLDVTDPEPPEPESPLYRLPNCILTPHIAGAVKENTTMQGRLVADEIAAFLDGQPLQHEVDLAQHDQLA